MILGSERTPAKQGTLLNSEARVDERSPKWGKRMERVEGQSAAASQIRIVYDAFRKKADGSWTSIRNSDVGTADGAIRIGAGMDFRRGGRICGLDIATLLDEESYRRTG